MMPDCRAFDTAGVAREHGMPTGEDGDEGPRRVQPPGPTTPSAAYSPR